MYTGPLPAVSNSETWSLSVTVTNDGDAVDPTGATITSGSRRSVSRAASRSDCGSCCSTTPARCDLA
jgi:hypothetical protein